MIITNNYAFTNVPIKSCVITVLFSVTFVKALPNHMKDFIVLDA